MTTGPRRLEELTLNSSAPPGQLLYDGWLLRFSPGKAKRARSVNPVYPSTLPLDDKVDHCERLYGAMGLPAIFRLSEPTRPAELEEFLAARGYERFETTEVREAEIDPAGLAGGEVENPRLEEWFDMVGSLRGSPIAQRAAHLARLAALPLPVHTAAILEAGVPVATGLAIREGGHVGLFDVVTREGCRRRGFARTIVAALLRWGWEGGARHSYLQVEEGNAAAIALYEPFGFAPAYRYWYRGRPEEVA
ncbi:MAG: GNAT family N-acetyltransferase [Betaproteobacteria bacterium]|nr:GNAT family N-acetyltransferase [Betaproteobacteria bacterium]PWB67051.1 MAG: N-acetyltransferase [Betaproteobacteria bacterium]